MGSSAGASGRRRVLAVGVLAGLLQVNFLLELVLPGTLPVGTSLVSELSAPGQPFALVYRLGDLTSALLTLEVARVLVVRWRSRTGLATALLTGLYAVGLGASALVPEGCDDPRGQCGGHVLLTAAAPLADRVHDLVSVLAALGLLVASATGALVLRRRDRARRAAGLAGTGLAAALTGAVVLGQVSASLPAGQGLVQRVQVVLSSLLVVLLADGVAATWSHPGAGGGVGDGAAGASRAGGSHQRPGWVSPPRSPSPPGC